MQNLLELLGNIQRTNPEWSGESGKWAGEHGVSVRRSPGWLTRDRAFTLGNTIFIPETAEEAWEGTDLVQEELPHVAQWRNEGILGFLGKHIWDLMKYGACAKTYNTATESGITHESYHSYPAERSMLMQHFNK